VSASDATDWLGPAVRRAVASSVESTLATDHATPLRTASAATPVQAGAGVKQTTTGSSSRSLPSKQVVKSVTAVYLDAFEASASSLKLAKERTVALGRSDRQMLAKKVLVDELYERFPALDGITQQEFENGVDAGHTSFVRSKSKRILASAHRWRDTRTHYNIDEVWDPEGPGGPFEFYPNMNGHELYVALQRRIERGDMPWVTPLKTAWMVDEPLVAAAEWFVDCYRLRVFDDFHDYHQPRGILATRPNKFIILIDFYLFCLRAVTRKVVPSSFDWKVMLAKAVELLPLPFDDLDAATKYGGADNMYDAFIGGRSLRYTAENIMDCSSEAAAKKALEDWVTFCDSCTSDMVFYQVAAFDQLDCAGRWQLALREMKNPAAHFD
jgi:hypothetical protein